MATKSILKTVVIRDEASARKLLSAFERGEKKRAVYPKFGHKIVDAGSDEIKEMFGGI
jgi:hypothetical protein